MSNLKEIICQAQKDMELSVSKDEFLAELAYERIRNREKLYSERFNHYLDLLEKCETNTEDLSRLGESLISLSNLMNSSCEELLLMINKYNKNLFNSD